MSPTRVRPTFVSVAWCVAAGAFLAQASLVACSAFGTVDAADASVTASDAEAADRREPADADSSVAEAEASVPTWSAAKVADLPGVTGLRVLPLLSGSTLVLTSSTNVFQCPDAPLAPCPLTPAGPGLSQVRYTGAFDGILHYLGPTGELRRLGAAVHYDTKGAATWATDDGARLFALTANDVIEMKTIAPTNSEADRTGRFQFVGPSTRILAAQNGGVAVARVDSGRVDNLALCRSWGSSFEDLGQVSDLVDMKIASSNQLVLLANGRVYTRGRKDELTELRQSLSSTGGPSGDASSRGDATAIEVDTSGNTYVATYDGARSRVFRHALSRGEAELVAEFPTSLASSSITKLASSSGTLYAATSGGQILRLTRP